MAKMESNGYTLEISSAEKIALQAVLGGLNLSEWKNTIKCSNSQLSDSEVIKYSEHVESVYRALES